MSSSDPTSRGRRGIAAAQPHPRRQTVLADLCRRATLDAYAPATVLVNAKYEYLYSLGPVHRYLRIAPGYPTQDLFAMTPRSVHPRLRSALGRAQRDKTRAVAAGLRHDLDDALARCEIAVQPVTEDGEDLLLVSFLDAGAEASASLEEVQTLNEAVAALDARLHAALEHQRATANDLENVLYSTDVATIFLDSGLNIRYFTPATRAIFNVIARDVGRPLADLNSRVPDLSLLDDAAAVLKGMAGKERELRTDGGVWYMRRVMPYRTLEGGTKGVVITFADITAQRSATEALDRARRAAERANAAKSRFLAAASHDLRQPLQSLLLLQGLIEKTVESDKVRKLVGSFRDTLKSMSGMLNALLDINQIEAGTVSPRIQTCRVDDVLRRLADEFTYGATEKGLSLRFVPSSLPVRTDPHLLEQMVRNLLANALKYTRKGRILIGCRRRGDALTIEVWDSGVGIPPHELPAIFDEYYQGANAGNEDEIGLGLGLSIIRRLSLLLGHKVQVRSVPGKGSVFSIHVALGREDPPPERQPAQETRAAPPLRGTVLVVEDDRKIRNLIEIALRDDGHLVHAADDGAAALELVTHGAVDPSLILADYNLPHETNGIAVTRKLRSILGRPVPAIILSGDITSDTLRLLSAEDCLHMPKPVGLGELLKAVQLVLAENPPPAGKAAPQTARPPSSEEPAIFILDDDRATREALRATFEAEGRWVRTFPDGETFLAAFDDQRPGCLVMDVNLPGMSGLDVLRTLRAKGVTLPIVMITGAGDVATAVLAMKAGASDFIEKPIGPRELLASVARALERSDDTDEQRRQARNRLAALTERQRDILDRVLAGQPSKVIAMDLGISQRTVEAHRAAIMKRMDASSLPALARLAMAAQGS